MGKTVRAGGGLAAVQYTLKQARPARNVAMYSPEANALIPRCIDPASGTPAFKSAAVRVVLLC